MRLVNARAFVAFHARASVAANFHRVESSVSESIRSEKKLVVRSQAAVLVLEDTYNALWASSKQNKRFKQPKLMCEDKFALLRQFKRTFGHCNVPSNLIVHGVRLGG
jgi:hypothetical protein